MSQNHLRCEECHQWHISGDNHARVCEPIATALEGETSCDRCGDSTTPADLVVGFCRPCVTTLERVMRGDYAGVYGL